MSKVLLEMHLKGWLNTLTKSSGLSYRQFQNMGLLMLAFNKSNDELL
jgi:hypothetical protein